MEKCPYCSAELKIDHEEGQGYEEDVLHTQECDSCEKTFTYKTRIILHYDLSRADCLNPDKFGPDQSKHDFRIQYANPACFSKMVCHVCGEERELTAKERRLCKIPSRATYMKWLKANPPAPLELLNEPTNE